MFFGLWHYLRGYVIINVSGFSTERFMNLASTKGIYLWDINKNSDGVTMKVEVRDFKKLKDCSKKTKCRVKIISKKGIPFKILKCKKQKGYSFGILVFVCFVYFMSSFVWNIEVKGNNIIKTEDIMAFCKEENLYVGQLKFRLENKELTKKIITNFEEISWVAITTKGTDITITVVETLPKVEYEEDEVIDVVSSKPCVIESIAVSKGTPMVRVGDVVDEGDILVSSQLILKDGETEIGKEYTHAKAVVMGKTTITKTNEVLLVDTQKIYTGKEKEDKSVVIGDYNINFISPNIEENWESVKKDEKKYNAGQIILPFKIVTETFLEYNEKECIITEDEGLLQIYSLIEKEKQELEFNEKILVSEETNITKTEVKIISETVFTMIEDVGIEKENTVENKVEEVNE